jgi:hypothetical protein
MKVCIYQTEEGIDLYSSLNKILIDIKLSRAEFKKINQDDKDHFKNYGWYVWREEVQ